MDGGLCQKSMQRPFFSQTPKRVGSGPLRPPISRGTAPDSGCWPLPAAAGPSLGGAGSISPAFRVFSGSSNAVVRGRFARSKQSGKRTDSAYHIQGGARFIARSDSLQCALPVPTSPTGDEIHDVRTTSCPLGCPCFGAGRRRLPAGATECRRSGPGTPRGRVRLLLFTTGASPGAPAHLSSR